MGIAIGQNEPHWNYLLALERDVDRISRYVEFADANFGCFSIEIARVLLAAGAEADVVAKQICRGVDPSSTAESINAYHTELLAAYPSLPDFEVTLPRYNMRLVPWDEWRDPAGVPFWWTAYNKTKHHRDTHYDRANLKNMLNAVCGLFVLTLYLYKPKAEAGQLLPLPTLLRAASKHVASAAIVGGEFGINFKL